MNTSFRYTVCILPYVRSEVTLNLKTLACTQNEYCMYETEFSSIVIGCGGELMELMMNARNKMRNVTTGEFRCLQVNML